MQRQLPSDRYRTTPTVALSRRLAVLLLLPLTALALQPAAVAQQAGTPSSRTVPLDRVVAVVNTEAITEREFEGRVALAERRFTEESQPKPPLEVLRRQVLEQMVLSTAMLQYAKEIGLAPGDAELDRAIDDIAERNGLTLQRLRQELLSRGVDFDVYRRQVAADIVMLRLREREGLARAQVSEAEIDAYAKKAGMGGGTGLEYDIAQILLKLPSGPTRAEVDRETRRAETLLQRARSGADFADLARDNSEGPEAGSGGDLGWRAPERVPELFLDAVAQLQDGEVAPAVLRSSAGLHVIKLIGKRQVTTQASTGEPVRATHVRHILLPANDDASEREAERRLRDFRQRIESGEDSFESLARQFSIDGSARRGGDIGWVYHGDTVPPFEKAMDALSTDAISEPVRSQFGVHLIQVLGRRDDSNSPERGRSEARRALREQKGAEAFDEWMRELRDRTYVDLRLEPPPA